LPVSVSFARISVALYVPYFDDLTSITAAVSMTPLSFVLPVVLWNKVHGATAPLWRNVSHYAFIALFALMGVTALIGACYDIRTNVIESESSS